MRKRGQRDRALPEARVIDMGLGLFSVHYPGLYCAIAEASSYPTRYSLAVMVGHFSKKRIHGKSFAGDPYYKEKSNLKGKM